jgi:hypothetical protein
VLLAATPTAGRQQVYSSLTGSSSALLGLALAAVAILAAFSPRPAVLNGAQNEVRLARARANLVGSLLVASFFLLVVLVTATVGLAVNSKQPGNWLVITLIEAAAIASILGLLLSGIGLALVIAERSTR